MKKMFLAVSCLMFLFSGLVFGQEYTVKQLPPSVVATVPQCGSMEVDAASTKEISITFSKVMRDSCWSPVQLSKESSPKIDNIKYLEDKKTCVIEVELEPNRTYALWLNSNKFAHFLDSDGNSAIPYLLVFKTK